MECPTAESRKGLGTMIQAAASQLDTALVLTGVFTIVFIGLVRNSTIRAHSRTEPRSVKSPPIEFALQRLIALLVFLVFAGLLILSSTLSSNLGSSMQQSADRSSVLQ
jgi:cytochrome c biogenesis factor